MRRSILEILITTLVALSLVGTVAAPAIADITSKSGDKICAVSVAIRSYSWGYTIHTSDGRVTFWANLPSWQPKWSVDPGNTNSHWAVGASGLNDPGTYAYCSNIS